MPAREKATADVRMRTRKRTFAVTVSTGRWTGTWPFGRIDVGRDSVVVRAWCMPWIHPVSASMESVKAVWVRRNMNGVYFMTIDDSAQKFADVKVQIPYSPGLLLLHLIARGYPVQVRGSHVGRWHID
jgi:hypothetical protein